MNKKTNLEENLTSVADSQVNKTEQLLNDNKKYIDSDEKLKQRHKEVNRAEELEKQDVKDRESNRELRENYANKMFHYMCMWSLFIVIVIMLSGFNFSEWKFNFQLDRWVLMTLIGSTTVSIFAIIQAIIKGIFKE